MVVTGAVHTCLNSWLETKGEAVNKQLKPVGFKIANQANNTHGIKVTDSYVSVRRLVEKEGARNPAVLQHSRSGGGGFSLFHLLLQKMKKQHQPISSTSLQ